MHPEKKFSREGKKALARVRSICLALPGATEKIAWGTPTFRAKKVFGMFHEDHHGDGRTALWCPAPKGAQQVLVDSEPKRFFRPPYVGPAGWVGVHLSAIDDQRLAEIVREAYLLVAPEKMAAQLSEDPTSGGSARRPRRPASKARSAPNRRRAGPDPARSAAR